MARRIKRILTDLLLSRGYYLGKLPPPTGDIESHLMNLFQLHSVDCVIDVGAHRGEFGSRLRQRGYEGTIISFEPISDNFSLLEEVTKDDTQWLCVQCALSRESGNQEMVVTNESMCASLQAVSSLGHEVFSNKMKTRKLELVRVERMDDILRRDFASYLDKTLYVKLDTQGHDEEVFLGGQSVIRHAIGFQSELAFQRLYEDGVLYKDMIELAESHGFKLSGIFPISQDGRLELLEADGVFVRSAHVNNATS